MMNTLVTLKACLVIVVLTATISSLMTFYIAGNDSCSELLKIEQQKVRQDQVLNEQRKKFFRYKHIPNNDGKGF